MTLHNSFSDSRISQWYRIHISSKLFLYKYSPPTEFSILGLILKRLICNTLYVLRIQSSVRISRLKSGRSFNLVCSAKIASNLWWNEISSIWNRRFEIFSVILLKLYIFTIIFNAICMYFEWNYFKQKKSTIWKTNCAYSHLIKFLNLHETL